MRGTSLLGAAALLVFGLQGACGSNSPDPAASAPLCRPPPSSSALHLSDAFPGLHFVHPVHVERFQDIYFVAEQTGRVWRVFNTGQEWASELFADFSERLATSEWEGGLLGLVLSPDFADTGEVFVSYTAKTTKPDVMYELVISRESPIASEPILSLDHHTGNHNGGGLAFGADRLLYIGIGDGEAGDPKRRAQDPKELFGKVLRLEVLDARPYAIPNDNPFANEVYALGLRNPWGFAFDNTGQLWLGDVGQDRWEEIDLITKGGNYGWPMLEGKHCFLTSCTPDPLFLDPIHEYPHVDGYAVTGGLVYRGKRLAVDNAYIFGDFTTGRIWALDTTASRSVRQLVDTGLAITGFAEDPDGEILVVDYGGHIMRIEPGEASPSASPTLRELGCLDANASLQAYDVNAPFWSDGLSKKRWFSIPDKTSINTTGDTWDFPPGTMFLKELSSTTKRIETRMLYRDPADGWLGYTFEWNEDQTDAVLLTDSKTVDVDGSPWTLPSRAQCFACHRARAGRVLGFQAAQLNRDHQLDKFSRKGLLVPSVDEAQTPALANPDDESVPIDARARAWLHTNCSFCHDGEGLGQAMMDLRFTSSLETSMTTLCGSASERIGALDDRRMPPLGSARVDPTALDVVTRWATSLAECTTEF